MEAIQQVEKIKCLFTFFGTELWNMVQELAVICFLVALLSICITEAIKRSDKYILPKIHFKDGFLFITNVVFSMFLAIVFVFVFDGKNGLLNTILYCITTAIFSWSLSILLYPCTKFFFDWIDIVNLKFKKMKLDSEIIVKQSQILFIETNKELLLSELKKEVAK